MKARNVIAIITILLIASVAVLAQTGDQEEEKEKKRRYLYEWTDNKGNVHIADELGKVPEKYREKARKTEIKKKQEPDQAAPEQIYTEPHTLEADESAKTVWQQRIRDAKGRLANAENRYRELEQKRTELLGRWGTPAYAPPEARLEAERIEKEMNETKKEIDDARNMIEVVIPEEARKAGVPPGWLRE